MLISLSLSLPPSSLLWLPPSSPPLFLFTLSLWMMWISHTPSLTLSLSPPPSHSLSILPSLFSLSSSPPPLSSQLFSLSPSLHTSLSLHIQDKMIALKTNKHTEDYWEVMNNIDYKFAAIPIAFVLIRIWSLVSDIIYVYASVSPKSLPRSWLAYALMYMLVCETIILHVYTVIYWYTSILLDKNLPAHVLLFLH